MISRLTIQGLAIIDSLSISFSPGFNVITGETGAGKSILIRSLNFLMGAKTSSEAVRRGVDVATVAGEFLLPGNHKVLRVLESLGIPFEETRERASIILRRQLSSRGRSQSWLNDCVVTTAALRSVGPLLVDIFGQHENQRLMDAAQHLDYVDDFVKKPNLKTRIEGLYRECSVFLSSLEQALGTLKDRQKNRDTLAYRVEELTRFSPSREDYHTILSLCRKADRVSTFRESFAKAIGCLEMESGESVAKSLWEVSRILGKLGNTQDYLTLREKASELAAGIEEFGEKLLEEASAFAIDENELERAQQRLFGYQDLFRKHATKDIDGLLADQAAVREELSSVDLLRLQLNDALIELTKKAKELEDAAKDLSRARAITAKSIQRRIESELHELAMRGAAFSVAFLPFKRSLPMLDFASVDESLVPRWETTSNTLSHLGENGSEIVQFLLASNPGEAMLPLTSIASGGELSRIMLAMKKALAADAETCVLVFDEIDAGISGRVADIVGRKMRELSESFQVICVSHLPQVAAHADTHFLVRKSGKVNRTESSIVRLSHDDSVREIARLLSGAEVSSPSLANAENLIQKARGKYRSRLTERSL